MVLEGEFALNEFMIKEELLEVTKSKFICGESWKKEQIKPYVSWRKLKIERRAEINKICQTILKVKI